MERNGNKSLFLIPSEKFLWRYISWQGLTIIFFISTSFILIMNPKKKTIKSIEIGTWACIEGGFGTRLVLEDGMTLGATPDHLLLWMGQTLTHTLHPSYPQYGYPRMKGQMVFWGNGVLNLNSKKYTELPETKSSIVAGTDASVIPSPRGGRYQPAFFAWSADGKIVVVTASWVGGTSSYPARALLLNDQGQFQTVLWEATDLVPEAAWIGKQWLILGTRKPLIFDRKGKFIAELESGTPALRIEASKQEDYLLLVQTGRLTVWDTNTWNKIGDQPGNWLDAAISPSGHSIVAVDFDGNLHIMKMENGISLINIVIPRQAILAVALGNNRIAAAFSEENTVCVASFREKY